VKSRIFKEVLAGLIKAWVDRGKCGLKACKIQVSRYLDDKPHFGSLLMFVHCLFFCSYKLRRVMRKAMLVSQQKFGVEHGLLTELTNYVADSLGEVYPEIRNRLKQVRLFYLDYCKGVKKRHNDR
jgi:hypothetical protein